MRDVPHAPGYTLAADAFMRPSELVGFWIAHQPLSVFPHFHEFYELALIVQGTALHTASSGDRRIRRGSVIFIAPGVSHGYRMGEDLIVYNCFLRVEAAQFDLPWARRDASLARFFGPPGIEPQHPLVLTLDEAPFTECLTHLEAIRQRPAGERSEAFDLGHMLLALDVLARHLEHGSSERPNSHPPTSALVASALDLLEHDRARHWTLDDLAGSLFVGSFHLVREFKRWVGVPPMAFLSRRRAEHAAMLLATTDAAVSEVGAAVGWPEPSHFSRRFRSQMGVSPRAYRALSRRHYAARRELPEQPKTEA